MSCIAPMSVVRPYRKMADSNVRGINRGENNAVMVPCGSCPACLKRRVAQWVFRLKQESKVSQSSCFITLTYEIPPISENGFPTLEKEDFQLFMKRLRKKATNRKLKYYTVGEYGSKYKRPHYHSIMYNLPKSIMENPQILSEVWSHGHVRIDPCNGATIGYVAGYVNKGKFEPEGDFDDRIPEFSLMSKRLGRSYITDEKIKYYNDHKTPYLVSRGGQRVPMPRYYKELLYDKMVRDEVGEEARISAEARFIEEFNDSFKDYEIWRQNQYRVRDKKKRLERQSF